MADRVLAAIDHSQFSEGVCDYAVWAARHFGKAFPWGTLAVNASGAFCAGWLLGSQGLANPPSPLWLFSVAGLLGGYTTVSSFSLQTLELWQDGQTLRAALNVGATLLLGWAMVALGWMVAGGSL